MKGRDDRFLVQLSFNGLKRFNYTRAPLRFYCETLNRFVIAKASRHY